MLRELSSSINDLIALNERLTPYLRTVERWLRENAEMADVSLLSAICSSDGLIRNN
jgi:hypothetical protein